MKHFKFYVITISLFVLTTVNSIAGWAFNNGPGCHNGTVGAPLDGGLLAILGAAGVAYFTARKKKKNQE